jgi:hypothetical protein
MDKSNLTFLMKTSRDLLDREEEQIPSHSFTGSGDVSEWLAGWLAGWLWAAGQ